MDYQQKGAGNWHASSNLVVSYTIVDGQFQHMYVKKINSFWKFHALKRVFQKKIYFPYKIQRNFFCLNFLNIISILLETT
jgi:hypothetical protein